MLQAGAKILSQFARSQSAELLRIAFLAPDG